MQRCIVMFRHAEAAPSRQLDLLHRPPNLRLLPFLLLHRLLPPIPPPHRPQIPLLLPHHPLRPTQHLYRPQCRLDLPHPQHPSRQARPRILPPQFLQPLPRIHPHPSPLRRYHAVLLEVEANAMQRATAGGRKEAAFSLAVLLPAPAPPIPRPVLLHPLQVPLNLRLGLLLRLPSMVLPVDHLHRIVSASQIPIAIGKGRVILYKINAPVSSGLVCCYILLPTF
mmetsp:Transcript_29144/g.58349  ORF Transcript_29144/g.58349 Transcript_29144/m.58349 type:complete len:224 (-) Transcript_29144:54-725(-)